MAPTLFCWKTTLSCGGTTGVKEYSSNWLIHGNRDVHLQGTKGLYKQLKPSTIFSVSVADCQVTHYARAMSYLVTRGRGRNEGDTQM